MVEWIFKKTNLYRSMEDDIFNYEVEMATKQNKIRNLERDNRLLRERLEIKEREHKNTIEDLINKLEIKENARRKAIGKAAALKSKINGSKNV